MTDFDVDPEAVLAIGVSLRNESTALDASGSALPEADAGVMSPVIENAIGALLSHAELLAAAMVKTANSIDISALNYYEADHRSREEMTRLMMPGASQAEIDRAVERVERADEIDLAKLMLPGDPDAAEQAVLDSPSGFEEAQQRFDERTEDLRNLLMPEPPPDGQD